MMVLIKRAKIVPALKGWLLIDFDDNNRNLVNINSHSEGVLRKCEDPAICAKGFVDKELQTVSWAGELDLDADNLYNHRIDMELVKNLVIAVKKDEAFTDFIDHEIAH